MTPIEEGTLAQMLWTNKSCIILATTA